MKEEELIGRILSCEEDKKKVWEACRRLNCARCRMLSGPSVAPRLNEVALTTRPMSCRCCPRDRRLQLQNSVTTVTVLRLYLCNTRNSSNAPDLPLAWVWPCDHQTRANLAWLVPVGGRWLRKDVQAELVKDTEDG